MNLPGKSESLYPAQESHYVWVTWAYSPDCCICLSWPKTLKDKTLMAVLRVCRDGVLPGIQRPGLLQHNLGAVPARC